MEGFLQIPGVYTFTQQGFITPTGTGLAVRVFSVSYVATGTSTYLTITNAGSGTTASSLTTNPILAVPNDVTGVGTFSDSYGFRFSDGCKVHTATGLTWGTITYILETA